MGQGVKGTKTPHKSLKSCIFMIKSCGGWLIGSYYYRINLRVIPGDWA